MDVINVLLLAVFQGVAEFLPISSSGHLAVLGNWLGIDPETNFSLGIVLHAGNLLHGYYLELAEKYDIR